MGEKELAARLADALKERDEAIALAVETSVQRDKALDLLTVATEAAVAPRAKTHPDPKPKPKEPTPAPAAPPPPLPSMTQFAYMSSEEKARVRATFGEDVEDRMAAAFEKSSRISNARTGGFSDSRPSWAIAADNEREPAKFNADAAWSGAPGSFNSATRLPGVTPATPAHGTFAEAQARALNENIRQAQARTAHAAPPAPPPRRAADGTFTPRAGKSVRLR